MRKQRKQMRGKNLTNEETNPGCRKLCILGHNELYLAEIVWDSSRRTICIFRSFFNFNSKEVKFHCPVFKKKKLLVELFSDGFALAIEM